MPDGAEVEIVETDRGGKSTYHGPGQLVCYPILDLTRHGQDVKRYCRDLEEALIQTLGAVGVEATRIEGLTGIWVEGPPRKIASIGVHITKWVTTHGYALNVDLDTAPFTEWITACGLADASFTTIARELGRPLSVDEVRPHAAAALEEVFGLSFEEIPADEGAGLWPQPLHERLTAKPTGASSAGAGSRRRAGRRALAQAQPAVAVGAPAGWEIGVGLARLRRLGLDPGAVLPGNLRHGIDETLAPEPPSADRDDDSRPFAGSDDHVLGLRRAVEEVPRLQLALLALDDQRGRFRPPRGTPPARSPGDISPEPDPARGR